MDESTNQSDFWDERYREGNTRWDLGGPTYALQYIIKLGVLSEYPRIFIPGCGSGYDAIELAAAGHQVTACDFSQLAVERLRNQAKEKDIVLEIWQADLFGLKNRPKGIFDAAYEYTCFCAIPPKRRQEYADIISHLVRPGGLLLWFVFPLDKSEFAGPVPHKVSLEDVREYFSIDWDWVFDFPSEMAPKLRRGYERIVILRRKES